MKVIAVASQKGGTGKTTLSGHLAVQAERAGAGPVALIDTDPQGSLSHWWNSRGAKFPVFVRTTISSLPGDLADLQSAGVNLVFIDTPPAITRSIIEVIKVADLVLVPIRPSPHDLVSAGVTVDLIANLDKPMVFIVNCATARARITGEAAIALSQHGTVAPTIIHNRTDFASSMIDGRTVMELSRAKKSTGEIEGLWDYLNGRIARGNNTASRVLDPGGLTAGGLNAGAGLPLFERPAE